MNKNQHIIAKCIDYTYDGLGVVKYDTFTIFVKDMIIDEEAEIIITKVNKNFAYGKIINLIKPSSERVEPLCCISKLCGGCQLQHCSLQQQASFKHNQVLNNIRRIGKIDNEILPVITGQTTRYRNKVMLPVDLDDKGQLQIGFYKNNSHQIIPVDDCLLQSERSNQLVNKIKELIIKYKIQNDIRHIMIRDFARSDQMMLVLIAYKKQIKDIDLFTREIVEFQPAIKSVILNINNQDTNVVLGEKEYLLYGSNFIQDILCDLKFNVSSKSFYQVNTYQTEVLYTKAIQLAKLNKDDVVLDLYCGAGTIGMVASKQCKKVYGVEIVEAAVKNAKENAYINNINNVEFICADVQNATKRFESEKLKFDCIFVDPPRKGCSSDTITSLLNLQASRIIYISCNCATLARDLCLLKDRYNIETIVPVDMFPNTHHIETIASLILK